MVPQNLIMIYWHRATDTFWHISSLQQCTTRFNHCCFEISNLEEQKCNFTFLTVHVTALSLPIEEQQNMQHIWKSVNMWITTVILEGWNSTHCLTISLLQRRDIIYQLIFWDPPVNYYCISRRQGSIYNPRHSASWHQLSGTLCLLAPNVRYHHHF